MTRARRKFIRLRW